MSGLSLAERVVTSNSANELAAAIVRRSGPYVRICDVWMLFGYPTVEAARKAASRGQLPVRLVQFPKRRGQFVRAVDLADWLFEGTRREATLAPKTETNSYEETATPSSYTPK